MKTVINVILGICALALGFICYRSIADEVGVDDEIAQRENVVKARLLDIKKAQEAYKEQHDTTLTYTEKDSEEIKEATLGAYAENFDELIAFLKSGAMKVKEIKKQGYLSEERQRAGWTEKKASQYIYRIEKKYGKGSQQAKDSILANGLWTFRSDTIWSPLIEEVFGKADYPVDSLRYIPFSGVDGKPQEFELRGEIYFKMSVPQQYTMDCSAHYNTFLKNVSKGADNERKKLIKLKKEKDEYEGLKIGALGEGWNNNAGNWE